MDYRSVICIVFLGMVSVFEVFCAAECILRFQILYMFESK